MRFWDYLKKNVWNVILGLFVLAVAAYAVFTLIRDRDADKPMANNQTSREEIVDQFQPNQQEQPPTNPEPSSPPNPPLSIRGEPNVLGATPSPAASPATETLTFKPYRNEALGFSASVPSDALMRATATEVQAAAGNQPGLYWTLTAHDGTTETLDSVEHQLRNSPSTASLVRTTLNGKPALQFTSSNLGNATGYALINKGRLYYLIGNFSNRTLLDSFTFF